MTIKDRIKELERSIDRAAEELAVLRKLPGEDPFSVGDVLRWTYEVMVSDQAVSQTRYGVAIKTSDSSWKKLGVARIYALSYPDLIKSIIETNSTRIISIETPKKWRTVQRDDATN